MLEFEKIGYKDLYLLDKFQPDGWTNIVPSFKFYIDSDFCLPLKAMQKGEIVGLGSCIVHEGTAWLAHIIVSPEHRNRGTGFLIVDKLIRYLKSKSIGSILLIATELGFPVYLKAGFHPVSEYSFYKREVTVTIDKPFENVIKYEQKYRFGAIELDRRISGENRIKLIDEHLQDSFLYVENEKVAGLYVPLPGEGLIVADNTPAGLELMKLKYSSVGIAALPSENIEGNEFLLNNGFIPNKKKGTRMIYGDNIDWQPDKIFSRISGNFG